MSGLTDKIVAEHMPTRTSACTCGGVRLGEYYPRHIAEVTEAAVRERVARDILATLNRPHWWSDLEQVAYETAAKIARGGAA